MPETRLIRYKGSLGSGVALQDGTRCPKGEAVAVRADVADKLLEERPDDFALVRTPRAKPAEEEK